MQNGCMIYNFMLWIFFCESMIWYRKTGSHFSQDSKSFGVPLSLEGDLSVNKLGQPMSPCNMPDIEKNN